MPTNQSFRNCFKTNSSLNSQMNLNQIYLLSQNTQDVPKIITNDCISLIINELRIHPSRIYFEILLNILKSDYKLQLGDQLSIINYQLPFKYMNYEFINANKDIIREIDSHLPVKAQSYMLYALYYHFHSNSGLFGDISENEIQLIEYFFNSDIYARDYLCKSACALLDYPELYPICIDFLLNHLIKYKISQRAYYNGLRPQLNKALDITSNSHAIQLKLLKILKNLDEMKLENHILFGVNHTANKLAKEKAMDFITNQLSSEIEENMQYAFHLLQTHSEAPIYKIEIFKIYNQLMRNGALVNEIIAIYNTLLSGKYPYFINELIFHELLLDLLKLPISVMKSDQWKHLMLLGLDNEYSAQHFQSVIPSIMKLNLNDDEFVSKMNDISDKMVKFEKPAGYNGLFITRNAMNDKEVPIEHDQTEMVLSYHDLEVLQTMKLILNSNELDAIAISIYEFDEKCIQYGLLSDLMQLLMISSLENDILTILNHLQIDDFSSQFMTHDIISALNRYADIHSLYFSNYIEIMIKLANTTTNVEHLLNHGILRALEHILMENQTKENVNDLFQCLKLVKLLFKYNQTHKDWILLSHLISKTAIEYESDDYISDYLGFCKVLTTKLRLFDDLTAIYQHYKLSNHFNHEFDKLLKMKIKMAMALLIQTDAYYWESQVVYLSNRSSEIAIFGCFQLISNGFYLKFDPILLSNFISCLNNSDQLIETLEIIYYMSFYTDIKDEDMKSKLVNQMKELTYHEDVDVAEICRVILQQLNHE
eukprot:NODE_238_length_11959_cov_0.380270.p2 type:complete len:766 gc:universal NODE_238_length_11959_cov_0.380270:9152-6855(-)